MFESLNISFKNLVVGDFNAILFAIVGMLVVFAGLSIISTIIAFLPKIIAHIEGKSQKVDKNKNVVKADPKEVESSDHELMIAIALALHMEQNYGEQNQKFTWDTSAPSDLSWKNAMHGEVLASRQNLPLRRL